MCVLRNIGLDIIELEKTFNIIEDSNESCIQYLNITRSIECFSLMKQEFHLHKEHYNYLKCK